MGYFLDDADEYFEVDTDFAMFTKEGNILLHNTLSRFCNHPTIVDAHLSHISEDEFLEIVEFLNIKESSDRYDFLIFLARI